MRIIAMIFIGIMVSDAALANLELRSEVSIYQLQAKKYGYPGQSPVLSCEDGDTLMSVALVGSHIPSNTSYYGYCDCTRTGDNGFFAKFSSEDSSGNANYGCTCEGVCIGGDKERRRRRHDH